MKKLLIVWGNWGPYHHARFRAFHDQARGKGLAAHGVELFPSSGYYEWERTEDHPAVHRLDLGKIETEFNLRLLLTRLVPFLCRLRPDIIFVPSYWHWSLFINITGRLLRAKIVMMNESHAGTEKARGCRRFVKKVVVRKFHAALVGGSPHRRHYASLGLDSSRIHLGYDAVDNDYFKSQSEAARLHAEELRVKFRLPEKYFLNLGRMVKKKNLDVLIHAYALLIQRSAFFSHDLVLVGSGEEGERLRALCHRLRLAVVDHARPHQAENRARRPRLAAIGRSNAEDYNERADPSEHGRPAVHFYGFSQIRDNPVFYALASAFVLPSSMEEWGLVVNEAMAAGLPVIVSKNAGCAENLVVEGRNGFTFDPQSAEELAQILERLADSSRASSMGAQSFRIISDWGCDRFGSGAISAALSALH